MLYNVCLLCMFLFRGSDTKYHATICSIVLNNSNLPFDITRSGPAIDLALKDARRLYNDTIEFKYVYRDGGDYCGPTKAGSQASDVYHQENVTVFIGPACSLALEHMAYMAAEWNLPVITPSGSSGILSNKQSFPTLTRIAFSLQEFAAFYLKLVELYKWKHVALIYESDVSFSKIIGGTFYEFLRTTSLNLVHFQIKSKTYTKEDYKLILEKANMNARVFILLAITDTIRKILISADELGYTEGKHVFLATYPVYQKFDIWERGDGFDQIAKKACQSVMFINLASSFDLEYQMFEKEMMNRSLIDYDFDYKDERPNILIPRFYDAVMIYAYILNETLAEGLDPANGREMVNRLKNRTFNGKSGKVAINNNVDRYTDLVLYDMTRPDSGVFKIVGFYDGKTKMYTPDPINMVHWPGDAGPPPDKPPCGFRSDSCPQHSLSRAVTLGLSISLTFVTLITIVILCFCYRRWKENSNTSDLWWWKIQRHELVSDKLFPNLSIISFASRRSSLKSISSDNQIGVAIYKGITVQLKQLEIREVPVTKHLLKEFKEIREINHTNIAKVFGACLELHDKYLVVERCSKGTLQDVLGNTEINLDAHFRFSLAIDIAQGMVFIHQSTIHHHGNLSSMVCLIDNRFSVKITDVGLRSLYSQINKDWTRQEYLNECLWKAPEHLRSSDEDIGSREGDVYSFGIILQEIITRESPFFLETLDLSPKEVLMKIKDTDGEPFRPRADVPIKLVDMYHLMKKCWNEDPHQRPIFTTIVKDLKHMAEKFGDSGNLLDNLLRRMELYANNLEKMVEEKTCELNEEKKRSEELLYQILPRSVAEKLKLGLRVESEAYESVTIYFSDIVGFTTISAKSQPMEVVDLLNDLYSCFDGILEGFDVYKVETIGDAYMVASGLPQRNGNRHATEIARTSLALLRAIDSFHIRHLPDERLLLRIGLHSGPVCAGVVGVKMPRYCLFGDTVNTASRMESHGAGLKIHMSDSTADILKTESLFIMEERGEIDIKGKGLMSTYWLQGERFQNKDVSFCHL